MSEGQDPRARSRLELVATLLLAFATVLTAWSAFESAKWSGVQATNFAAAGAARTESVRASDEANSEVQIDVATFVAWVTAVATERQGLEASDKPYEPEPGTLSGFLFERLRDEFRPAVDAWLATRPLISLDAEPTPFDLPEYSLAAQQRAEELVQDSEAFRDEALLANQISDNYVLLTVIFAAVLLFAGISTKLENRRDQLFMLGLAGLLVLGALVTLLTFPVEF